MKYLIMKCEELDDDANRTPIAMTNNYKKWYTQTKPDYLFEVYRLLNDNTFELVQNYETAIDEGMALYYWGKDDDWENKKPTIIYKYPHKTRDDEVPKEVNEYIEKGKDLLNWLSTDGTITFYINNKYYVYGEYRNNHYSIGY